MKNMQSVNKNQNTNSETMTSNNHTENEKRCHEKERQYDAATTIDLIRAKVRTMIKITDKSNTSLILLHTREKEYL